MVRGEEHSTYVFYGNNWSVPSTVVVTAGIAKSLILSSKEYVLPDEEIGAALEKQCRF